MPRHTPKTVLALLAESLGHPAALLVVGGLAAAWLVLDERSFGWGGFIAMLTVAAMVTIQASYNRTTTALHAKLDELIDAIPGARAQMRRVEEHDEDEIERRRP